MGNFHESCNAVIQFNGGSIPDDLNHTLDYTELLLIETLYNN